MPEALKCPSCSAPLDYPASGGATMRCPYCNTTITLVEGQRGRVYITSKPSSLAGTGPMVARTIAVVVTLIVGLIIAIVALSTHNQPTAPAPVWVPPVVVTPPLVEVRDVTASQPSFAHSTVEFGAEGFGAGQFKDSRSIAIDGNGHIYVGEFSDGRIQVFDMQGKFIAEWSIGAKRYLLNLTADRHGTVYAVIPSHILRYEGATGMPLGEMENTLEDKPEMYMDAFAALNGDVYALAGDSDIVILGNNGLIKRIINGSNKVGENVSFEKIAVLSTGEIYALDRTRGIFKFAPDGRYINRFGGGESGTDLAQLVASQDIAVDGQGRVYISANGPAVRVFSGDGQYLNSFGGIDIAFGMAIDDQNEIYACFRNEHQIRKFVLDQH